METKPSMRAARESDYEEVARLIGELQALHAEARPDLYRMPEEKLSREIYADWLSREESWAYVVEAAGSEAKPSALRAYLSCRLQATPGNHALQPRLALFVDELVVDAKHRGSGVGRMLIDRARDLARESGVDALELNVTGFNEDAAAFYAALGFRVKSSKLEFELR